jgi:hypothetical protein
VLAVNTFDSLCQRLQNKVNVFRKVPAVSSKTSSIKTHSMANGFNQL